MKLKNDKVEVEAIEAEGAVIAPKKRGRKKKNIEEKTSVEEVKNKVVQPEKVIENTTEGETVEKNIDKDEDFFVQELVENIEKWKVKYKKIYKNDFEENIILWRRLTRGEYKTILKETENDVFAKQEAMVRAALLYPYDESERESLIEDNAGFATVMAEEILGKSGFAVSYTEEL